MALRFPQRQPRDAAELYQWLRELLPDLEIKVVENCEIGTQETIVAHGLGSVPFFVRCSTPHCISVVRQTRKADSHNVYLRSTNRCVVDVFVAKTAQLSQTTAAIKGGGFGYPDWDAAGSPPPEPYPGPMTEVGQDYDGGLDLRYAKGKHSHPAPNPVLESSKLYTGRIENSKLTSAKCILAPYSRWANVDATLIGYVGCNVWYPLAGWTEGPAGTWTRDSPWPLPTAFIDDVSPFVGMRLFVGAYGIGIPELPYAGIYTLTDDGSTQGGVLHHAVITRATDADAAADFTFGRPVHILAGTQWGGHTYRYSGVDSPALDIQQMPFYDAGSSSIYASGVYGFGSVWTAAPGISTWHKQQESMGGGGGPAGPIWGVALDGSGTVPINVGDTFFVWLPSDAYSESAAFGLYTLVSTYDGGASPVIQRIPNANTAASLHGSIAIVNGTYYTETDAIATLDVSATSWSTSSTCPAATDVLVTPAQLSSAGVSSTPSDVSWSSDGSPGDTECTLSFPTLAGAIGVTTLSAGRQTLQVEKLAVTTAATSGVTTLKMRAVVANASLSAIVADLFTAETPPIPANAAPSTVTMQVDVPTDVTWASPTYRLILIPTLHTTCASPVTMSFRYNSLDRGTWWSATAQFPIVGGTNRHPDLIDRDLDRQHPSGAIAIDDGSAFTGNLASKTSLREAMSVLDSMGAGTRSIYLPQSVLDIDSATVKERTALGAVGQRTLGVALPHGHTNGVSGTFLVPVDAASGTQLVVRPIWVPSASASGAVRWEYTLQHDGIDITWTPTQITFTGLSGALTANEPLLETGGASGSFVETPGTWVRLGLRRVGGNGADTYSGQAVLLGIQIDYTAVAFRT